MSSTRMTSSSGRSCQRLGFWKVADGGQGPVRAPAAPARALVPAEPAVLPEPPRPAGLPAELVAPAVFEVVPALLPPFEGTLPLEPAWAAAPLPEVPDDCAPATFVSAPAPPVRPPALSLPEGLLLQAPLSATVERIVKRVAQVRRST